MNTINLIRKIWDLLSKPNKKLDNMLVRLLIVTFIIWIIARSIF